MTNTKLTLLAAAAFGLMVGAASAQDYPGAYDNAPPPPPPGYGPDDNAGPPPPDAYGPPPPDAYGPPPSDAAYGPPPETVIVIAPPRVDHSSLAPTEITKLSMNVAYSDLDLRTDAGAYELHRRVRAAAREVCDELITRFPHALAENRSCYKRALDTAMNHVDTAIYQQRNYAYYDADEE
jgi:UrcA family protein